MQHLRYNVVLYRSDSTMSIDRYFKGGNVSFMANRAPSANLNFSNLDKELEEMISTTKSYNLFFRASKDDGHTWFSAFDGLLEEISYNIDANGRREIMMSVVGSPGLRYNFLSPNQICVGEYYSLSQLFVGTPTSSDGLSWDSDSQGNYPNGFLYDTGYEYSDLSVTKYFDSSTVMDVPLKYGYGGRRKIDAISSYLEPIQGMFFIDDINSELVVLKNPKLADFPGPAVTLSVGTNINKLSRAISLNTRKDRVTVIGGNPDVWAEYGDGLYEDVIRDSDIYEHPAAFVNAHNLVDLNSTASEEWKIEVAPMTQSLLGKSILIKDLDDTEFTRSVIGVVQDFEPSRWTTKLELNLPEITQLNSMKEMMQDLSHLDDEDNKQSAYIRLRGGTTSWAWEIDDADEGAPLYNVLAVAIGTSSDEPGHPAGVDGAVLVKRIEAYHNWNGDGWGETQPTSASSWFVVDYDEGIGRIRQIGLIANDRSDGEAYLKTNSFTWSRPTTEWSSSGYAMLGTLTNYFPLKIIEVRILPTTSDGNGQCHPKPASAAGGYYITNLPGTTSIADYPPPTESGVWDNPEGTAYDSYQLVNPQKSVLSRDLAKTSGKLDAITISGAESTATEYHPAVCFKFKAPWTAKFANNVTIAETYLENIEVHAVYRGLNTQYGSTYPATATMYVWNRSTNEWQLSYTFTDVTVSSNNMEYRSLSVLQYPGASASQYIDYDGYFNLGLSVRRYVDGAGIHNGKYDLILGYVGVVFHLNDMEDNIGGIHYHFEKCPYNKLNGTFRFSLPPTKIVGLFLTASTNSAGVYYGVGKDYSPHINKDVADLVSSRGLDILNEDKVGLNGWDLAWDAITMKNWTTYHGKYDEWSDKRAYKKAKGLDNIDLFWEIQHRGYAWIAYETKATWDIDKVPTLDTNFFKMNIIPEFDGISSTVSMSMWNAPVYGCKLGVVYEACGTTNYFDSSVISRVKIEADPESTLREGIDKNDKKRLLIQYDLNYTSSEPSTFSCPFSAAYNKKYLDYLEDW